MSDVKEKFQLMIRRILLEELEKRNPEMKRVPEQDGNGTDANKKKNKTFEDSENPRDKKSKDQLLSDLTKVVKDIDDEFLVVWDDHDDLKIDARDLMSMIITPDWEDHYVIELMTRNEDRIWVTGYDWEQVKEFVKKNLGEAKSKYTNTDKSLGKTYVNREDQIPSPDKGLPQKDKPKLKPLTTEPPSKTKNKEKDYTEDQNKEEDNPDKPMKDATEFKRQIDHKVQDPVKNRKRVPDKKLVVKQS
jgi:hypothetical protein